jgi:hypothetical protein
MKRTAALIASALVTVTASGVSAQTFTYQSQGDPPTSVGMVAPNGSAVMGSYMTGSGATTWADGAKSTYTYKCISTTQPPNNTIYTMHMICDAAAADGNFSVTFGCNLIDAKAPEVACVGGLYGKSGRYAGRRGTITNHRKGDVSGGTGQWHK